jgi:hypothetical protein
MNVLTLREEALLSTIHTPRSLMQHAKLPVNFEHYGNPMVHPLTGRTISSYKKLMHDPATTEVWQTAFGKDFRGMAQGCNKTGQKGTNAMFVMSHDEITHALAAKKNSLMQIPLSTTAPKRKIPTASASRLGGTKSITKAMHLCEPLTCTLQSCIGTVSSAQRMRNTCALILKKIISPRP